LPGRGVADVFARPALGAVARSGQPHWPVKLYVKCLMLQKRFGLSDPRLEEQLRDRINFRHSVGPGLAEPTPDETSLVVFRRRLRETPRREPTRRADEQNQRCEQTSARPARPDHPSATNHPRADETAP